ncbi:MAG: hypothetical protein R6V27_03390 [Balneolaceae bacterium]
MISRPGSFGNEELLYSESSNEHFIAIQSMIQINKIAGILIFIVTLSAGSLQAQIPILIHDEDFRQDAVVAIDSLYNRNVVASNQIMDTWKNRHPEHPIWEMWDAMELWWVVLEDLYDHSYDDRLMEAMQRSDYAAGQLLNRESNHPDALIIRALANGYIARHYSNRDSWLASVRTARKAYNSYSTLMEVEPDFADNLFVRGMISYYAAYIPEEYPVVRAVSWFMPDGDREEGLREIEKATEEGVFSQPEATYFMGNILLNYEQETNAALGYFRKLTGRYPDNGYYRRLLVRTLSEQNRNEDVLAEIERATDRWQEKPEQERKILYEELRFWEGRALYRMNLYDDALRAFNSAIEHGKELPNRPDRLYYSVANYYAGLTAEAMQNNRAAKEYYTETVDQNVEGDFKSRARERLRQL